MVCGEQGYVPEVNHILDAPKGVMYRVCDPTKMLSFYTPKISLVEGIGNVLIETKSSSNDHFLARHHHISIPQGSWHKLTNTSDVDLVIIEIQHGIECIEEDIERKE
jgi:hypothetical protein